VSEVITLLLDLQEKDRQCIDLSAQIEHLNQQKDRIEQKLQEEHTAVAQLRIQLEQLDHESRMKNLEVDNLDMQIRDYQKQLDTGIISYKEMEALRTKITQQREQMSELEDEALALMDDIEAARTRLKGAEETLEKMRTSLASQNHNISEQIAKLTSEIATRKQERAETATKIRPHLLALYETLHEKFSDAVVAIIGGSCSGCKLKVSANTVERTRSGGEIVNCENCSRILYIR
jgi:hypothetical protein